ncbi:MAG: YdiU family protein [Pseudomonadales bacterium]
MKRPIQFDNSYARLADAFYALQEPTPVAKPELIRVNGALAELLDIDKEWLASEQGVLVLAGNSLPEGAQPLSAAYAGHQFGGWNPQLGDGRAVLLGEVIANDGQRYDLQLKGAGRTPWSRGGDGRSPLGPVLREYIVSEAMHALSVPSSRSLGAVLSGEQVFREEVLPGAVLCRVARSHIRIGTFQYFAARKDTDSIEQLSKHVIERHYPEANDNDNPALALLQGVIDRQVTLVTKWQLLGFIHGVMNTDNMLLSGETIDYGPCAFLDEYQADKVFSSIDTGGRYAYQNQPGIAHWNLMQLAQSLLPVIRQCFDSDEAAVEATQSVLDKFPALYTNEYRRLANPKFGFAELRDGDDELVKDWFELLGTHKLDFTLSFRRLYERAEPALDSNSSVAHVFDFPEPMSNWLQRWQVRFDSESDSADRAKTMRCNNPAIIARNHLIEKAIVEATEQQSLDTFNEMVTALETPFDYNRNEVPDRLLSPPLAPEVVHRTFCGT